MKASPLGGRLWTPTFKFFFFLFLVGFGVAVWRFAVGLGPTTNLNDGYPWGLWIVMDVVVGTALACGGYAVALMVYVLNRGEYHPLVRPALLTSLLGYAMGVFGVALDVGRPWLIMKIPLRWDVWNYNSVLLEVALCIGAYLLVLFIESSPVFLEKIAETKNQGLKTVANGLLAVVNKSLILFIALGVLLPTMHQSSLGALLMLAPSKLHPLWHTGVLPLLYLLSVLAVGYAVIVMESTLASHFFGRKFETELLAKFWIPIVIAQSAFVLIRFVDLAVAGRLGLTFSSGGLSIAFWAETLLFVVPVFLLMSRERRHDPGQLFYVASLLIAGAVLYRFDTFLIAFDAGPGWTYFPSVPEILVTLGIISFEVLMYIFLVKRFPVLEAPASASAS